MNRSKKAQLVEGSIGATLFRLTLPMVLAMLGMVAFNLADTYFVGQLGTQQLAAMSFTFPVVMVISSFSLGLGIGTSAIVSRAIGEGDQQKVQRLTTDSLLLSFLLVSGLVVMGLLTITPLFRALGATPEILPLIKKYMRIWYPGMIAVVIPMVGNNAIRATGDTKTPSMIMLVAVCANIILDPLLIFGFGPIPSLGIAGAALATVGSRMLTLSVAIWVLSRREHMLRFARPPLRAMLNSWKQVLYIGLPAAATNMLLPLSAGIITRLIANYGAAAVAGFGVATRIEMFALMPMMALSSVLGPFVGQNWGAKQYDRVLTGIAYSQYFSLSWGAVMFLTLAGLGNPIAALFNSNPTVIATVVAFFGIVPLGYGAQGMLRLSTITLSVLHRPLHSASLTLTQAFVLYVPCAYIGSYLLGLRGIFLAAAGSNLLTAFIAFLWLKSIVGADQRNYLAQQVNAGCAV